MRLADLSEIPTTSTVAAMSFQSMYIDIKDFWIKKEEEEKALYFFSFQFLFTYLEGTALIFF